MMMTSKDCFHTDPLLLVACSCIGKNHIASGLPNQDAYWTSHYPYGDIIVVADGVGSEKHSEYASQAVVKAVDSVFSQIAQETLAVEDLVDSLCFQFRQYLNELYDGTPSTTCVFCVNLFSKGLFIGQIGDGICCGYINGEQFVFQHKDASFANIVNPLTPGCPPDRWSLMHFSNIQEVEVLLATDGVADDILPGRESEFAHYMVDLVEKAEKRLDALNDILQNWETPQSNDDKTIGLYHFHC